MTTLFSSCLNYYIIEHAYTHIFRVKIYNGIFAFLSVCFLTLYPTLSLCLWIWTWAWVSMDLNHLYNQTDESNWIVWKELISKGKLRLDIKCNILFVSQFLPILHVNVGAMLYYYIVQRELKLFTCITASHDNIGLM